MKRLDISYYKEAISYVDQASGGAVYSLSIAEQIQHGDIWVGTDTALFWHDAGFACMYGACEEEFLDEVYATFLGTLCKTERRFCLFLTDERAAAYLQRKGGLSVDRRYFYAYRANAAPDIPPLPAHLQLREIDKTLFERIEGKVTPLFSWRNAEEFLTHGKGYCIVDGDTMAAWAFSAAVSSGEIDIGVETRSEYRHSGFGTITAGRMIQYCLRQQKRPVWACLSTNPGSQKLAEKLGFEKCSECVVIRKT